MRYCLFYIFAIFSNGRGSHFGWSICVKSSSSSSDFWLTCRYRGHIHNSGPAFRQLACCTHGRSHTRSPGVSIMRVDSWELPLSAIPLCQLLPSHLGPPRPTLSITCMSKAVLTAPLEKWHKFETTPFADHSDWTWLNSVQHFMRYWHLIKIGLVNRK